MAPPSELRTSLPSFIDPESVRAAVRAPGSPGSLGGETWLLDIEGRLAVLVRSSIFDPLEALALADDAQPVELHEGSELRVRPAAGPAFVVRPSAFEVDAVRALLAKVEGVASLASPASAASPGQRDATARPPDPVTLTDLDLIDSDLEGEVGEAIAAGDYERTLASAHEVARQSSLRERDEWSDLIEVVTLLHAHEHVAAYLWTCGARTIPASVTDALFSRLARELERRDELVLAWAALGRLLFEEPGQEQARKIEARLGRDGPTLAREVSERARSFFAAPAEAGERRAQRGLAEALMELDELEAALTWIRRAIAAERFDFEARMLETRILSLLAIDSGDDRELLLALQKAADDFHDRPEPLVDLADHVEYDDPARAIDCLRQAQEREFDELVLMTLVDLLEANGRRSEVIREIEQALDDPDSVALVKDLLREKLVAARTRLAPGPVRAETTAQATPKSSGQPGASVVLAIVVVAVVLGLVLALLY